MNNRPSRRRQYGYLLEIPILLMAVGIVLATLLPILPPLGQKILMSIAAVLILFCLFYMIVIPGWMPSDNNRLKPPWSVLVFLLVAAAIIFFVVLFIRRE